MMPTPEGKTVKVRVFEKKDATKKGCCRQDKKDAKSDMMPHQVEHGGDNEKQQQAFDLQSCFSLHGFKWIRTDFVAKAAKKPYAPLCRAEQLHVERPPVRGCWVGGRQS